MTMSTPLPSPTADPLHYQRLYAAYTEGRAVDPTIATKIAAASITAGQEVMGVSDPSAVGQGRPPSHVVLYVVGEGWRCGVALDDAEVEQPVRVLMHALIKGERLPPPVKRG